MLGSQIGQIGAGLRQFAVMQEARRVPPNVEEIAVTAKARRGTEDRKIASHGGLSVRPTICIIRPR
jgi:hypothetical protein